MGVAMVSGTFVLTDTIKHGFSQIFSTALQNSDVVITGKAAFGNDQNAPSFPASALDKVLKLPGVADAAGGAVLLCHSRLSAGARGPGRDMEGAEAGAGSVT